MACVAWPTCGLAITESERALPGIIDQLEVELAKLGLSNETFTLRMTGCPNGCARPYNCDIGLVGKAAGKYTIFVGGRLLGDRLNFIYKDMVPADDIVPTLVPLLAYFKQRPPDGRNAGRLLPSQGTRRPAWPGPSSTRPSRQTRRGGSETAPASCLGSFETHPGNLPSVTRQDTGGAVIR